LERKRRSKKLIFAAQSGKKMANILSVENLTHHYGDVRLFNEISFGLEEGEKAALIARNGTGKTTLLNVIARKLIADAGTVTIRNGIKTSYLNQDPGFEPTLTVLETLFSSDNETVVLVREYEKAIAHNDQEAINRLVEKMDQLNAWDYESRVKQILAQLKITNLEQPVSQLSGGQIKRIALAQALISEPDFLILDEPTNHLDLEMIDWLEDYLSRNRATLLMVTHDRFFLDRVCNTIYEMDNENLYHYQGNYSYFLTKREERLNQRNLEIEKARNLLKKEQDWMNRMPQARGTKAKYRIDAFYDLKDVAGQKTDQSELVLDLKANRLGQKVANLEHISKAYDGKTLIHDFSYRFLKGDKIGIIGNNGTGKSTLLNILTGKLKPDSGHVETGETVVFGYYRQEGIKLDESKKVIDVISEISEVIDTGNGKSMNAAQFLRFFLFSNEMHYVFVNKLSGGEKKRLYLMTVLMKNPNFLILDEPTNDLDIQTLNVLEEFLITFPGCVLIVSHDRFFLDKVTDTLFVLGEKGIIKHFPGNYSDYNQYKKEELQKLNLASVKTAPVAKVANTADKPRKLTYKEKQELSQLEVKIAALELEKSELENNLASGTMQPDALMQASTRLGTLMNEMDELENRWIELNELV
jgi:ATP-binding cassette subfamily F protein uup